MKRVLSAPMIVRIRELNFFRFGGPSSAACAAASAQLKIPPSAFCRLLITWSADAPGSGGTMLQDCHYEGTCSVVPSDKGLSERICSNIASVHLRCRDGLPTLRLLRACGYSNTRPQQCGVAEPPAHAISQVSEHVL